IDGPADQARFNLPMGISYDPGSKALVVADTQNNRIRSVDAATGGTATLASGGSRPDFFYPTAAVRSGDGRLFIAAPGDGGLSVVNPDGTSSQITYGAGTS